MIRPNHECAWSAQKETLLEYRYGRFETAGTSLPVLLDALRAQPLRWYPLAYGEVYGGVPQNLLLVGVNGTAPPVPGQRLYSDVGPLNSGLEELAPVGKCVLSETVRATLGIEERDGHFSPKRLGPIQCVLHLHDDCFASLEPVDDALLERLVHGTLKLHSQYLGHEIDWQASLKGVSLLLKEAEEVKLRSDPKALAVHVEHSDQLNLGKIVIRDGRSSLHTSDTS